MTTQPPNNQNLILQLLDGLGADNAMGCTDLWISDEEIGVVAQHGIDAISEADRDRVLRAIAANEDGAGVAFELAASSATAFGQCDELSPDSYEFPAGGEQPPEVRTGKAGASAGPLAKLTLPTWGLAASLAFLSAVGLVVGGGQQQPMLGAGSKHGPPLQNIESLQANGAPEIAMQGTERDSERGGAERLSLVLLGTLAAGTLGTLVLAPAALRRLKKITSKPSE